MNSNRAFRSKYGMLIAVLGTVAVLALVASVVTLRVAFDHAAIVLKNPKELLDYKTDLVAKVIGGFGQVIAGLIVLGTLYVGWQKLLSDRDGLVTTRLSAAAALLGQFSTDKNTPNVAARLGGVYALEAIAKDTPRLFWPVVEILSGYVRSSCALEAPARAPAPRNGPRIVRLLRRLLAVDVQPAASQHKAKLRTDIQAALRILGRVQTPGLPLGIEGNVIDLRFSNLAGGEFWRYGLQCADLWGCDLTDARLDGAQLQRAKLQETQLVRTQFGDADLTGAFFDGADISGASLEWTHGMAPGQLANVRWFDADTRYPSDVEAPPLDRLKPGPGRLEMPASVR